MNIRFLILTFLSNTQSSIFQRGNVYAEGATEDQKKAFQADFRRRLWELAYQYAEPVSEAEHLMTIQNFADELSRAHPDTLANGRFRIGTAQKAVNLFLKFLWSIEMIPEPPHCPIDRTVLAEIGNNQNWTELDDIEAYKSIIAAIRQKAGQQTPAQWEYNLWNRKAQQGTGGDA